MQSTHDSYLACSQFEGAGSFGWPEQGISGLLFKNRGNVGWRSGQCAAGLSLQGIMSRELVSKVLYVFDFCAKSTLTLGFEPVCFVGACDVQTRCAQGVHRCHVLGPHALEF